MLFPAQGGQFHLLLSLAETHFLIRAETVKTVWASHAPLVEFRLLVLVCYWMSAAIALIILTFFERMIDGNSVVEDKTFTFPRTLVLRHLLEVFQDAALQMVDLFETLFQHEGTRFASWGGGAACHIQIPPP